MSSSMFYLELLLKIPPDEVLLDFLAQCGLTLSFEIERPEGDAYKRLRIATAIERAPESVRGCILAGLRHVALLADATGLDALRAANEAHAGQVNPLHLPDAPAQCALWMYLRHPAIFDDAVRMRGLYPLLADPMPQPLDYLRRPLTLPDEMAVDNVRLLEATMLDEITGGEIAIMAPAGDTRVGVLEVLDIWMPIENPMRRRRFRLVEAVLGVEFFPEPGQPVGRSVMLALKRRGGSNLGDFDVGTRAQLETWLIRWRQAPGRDAPMGSTLTTTV